MEPCLFCNQEENYNRNSNTEFACIRCVQLLLGADQDDLKQAHSIAIDKGYDRKAKAIESFLIPEEINVRETKQVRRNMVRKRHMRTVRPSRNQLRAEQATI